MRTTIAGIVVLGALSGASLPLSFAKETPAAAPPPGSASSPDYPVSPGPAAVGPALNLSEVPVPQSNDLPRITEVPAPVPTIPIPQARAPHESDQMGLEPEFPAAEVNDLWTRIREGFSLPDLDGPLVEKHEDWYADRPDYMARMIDRSRKYLYFIVGEIEKRKMPMEIALLPMIESAYNPAAYSHMKAAGMWQFIPSTGKHYGLKQNFWYDGRRDVMAATRAALDYLQRLYVMFDDWQLALAAYNWGEGAVARAMSKNRAAGKSTNYLSLTMPVETRNYLPKLQAVKNIVADPEAYGFDIASVPDEPYFIPVKVPGQMDVKVAAKLANLSVDEFRNLNPGHNRPVIIPAANKQLLLPKDKVDLFHENLENFDSPLVTWQTYRVQRRERLRHVAVKFNTTVAKLCEANGLTLRSRLRPGQLLLVPARNPSRDNVVAAHADHADFAPARDVKKIPVRRLYRVKRGETLFAIATKHSVTVAQLKTWNRLRGNAVRAGQVLTVKNDGARLVRSQKVALR